MVRSVEPIAKPKRGVVRSGDLNVTLDVTGVEVVEPKHRTLPNQGAMLLYKVTGVRSGNRPKMLGMIRKGLPFKVIVYLEKAYRVPRKQIAETLSIPISTLTRRKAEGRLRADESDRVARLARLKDAALDMMQGDDAAAVQWLHTPLEILGNETPMTHSVTEMGARDVEDLIGRIRHGVFS